MMHIDQFVKFLKDNYGINVPDYAVREFKQDCLVECDNCGEKVEMITTGEFCPKCYC